MTPSSHPDIPQRLPSLDGIRAFCICGVAFAHLMGTSGFPRMPAPSPGFWPSLTSLSVRTFFVLSGFLITTILHNELRRTGGISLALFYWRRALRIVPACYLYVAVLALLQHLGWFQLRRWDLLALITFTTNYHHDRSWYTGHTWSLGVEEQFYLLWPLALRSLDARQIRRLIWLVIAAAPVARVILYRSGPTFLPGIGETFPTVADVLATGALLAILRRELGDSAHYLAFLRSGAFWAVPVIVAGVAVEPSDGIRLLIGETIMNFGIAVVIDRFTRFPLLAFGRVLNSRPAVALGAASYSLFIWQQMFLNPHSTLRMARFPNNLALATAAGFSSYFLIERPIRNLRQRWEAAWRRSGDVSRGPAGPRPAIG